jgi:cytochrome d ubiquinol oxidase subunit II
MNLGNVWFFLFVAIISGYVILDGFDLGVGILHPFVAKCDEERRLSLNSIGPIWDGNEVWLITGGGVLFAAFPIVYATVFSGFYPAMMLVLLAIILRTVAIEFRSKREGSGWRGGWDMVFFLGSAGLALLLGVAFGNLITGVPLNQQGVITIDNVFDLLHPFDLLVGVTAVAMLVMHGAVYLNLKTDGDLQQRVQRFIPWLMGGFAVLAVATALTMAISDDEPVVVYHDIWPFVFPVGAAVAFAGVWFFLRRGEEALALVSSGAMIALLVLSTAIGLFPNLLISSTNTSYNLTVSNSASQHNTLTVMLIIAVIGIPFVLLYTAGVYYIFRGKVRLSPDSY